MIFRNRFLFIGNRFRVEFKLITLFNDYFLIVYSSVCSYRTKYLFPPSILNTNFNLQEKLKRNRKDMINIVDNDKSIREGYRILLKSAGFDCRSFETAEEFLHNLQTGETDLLLLDIHLNGLNGFDLLEHLKNKGLHSLVIIISSLDNQESRKLAKSYGALAYLRKPIDSEALIDIIKYNLDAQKTKERSTYL